MVFSLLQYFPPQEQTLQCQGLEQVDYHCGYLGCIDIALEFTCEFIGRERNKCLFGNLD